MVQYPSTLDTAFGALADPTRRGILERLSRREATITELADEFGMTLTGVKKHVQVLEAARLLATRKVGRVRTCGLGPRKLHGEMAWISGHMQRMEERFNRLEAFLGRTREES
jgi:DNA-binding transcriptional ArsR family regulator